MKKVMFGKLYDTETAALVFSNEFAGSLYKTAAGAFFMVPEDGNPMDWQLLDEDSAKYYVEIYGTGEDYIAAFGAPEEG